MFNAKPFVMYFQLSIVLGSAIKTSVIKNFSFIREKATQFRILHIEYNNVMFDLHYTITLGYVFTFPINIIYFFRGGIGDTCHFQISANYL